MDGHLYFVARGHDLSTPCLLRSADIGEIYRTPGDGYLEAFLGPYRGRLADDRLPLNSHMVEE